MRLKLHVADFLMHAWRESGANFVLVHTFDTCGRAKLNQNPACQELQIRQTKGLKNDLRSNLRASNLKIFPWGDAPEGPPYSCCMQSCTPQDHLNFTSTGPVAPMCKMTTLEKNN